MIRKTLVCLLALPTLVAGNCQQAPLLTCANPLDASTLGFVLAVPAGFDCGTVSPVQALFVLSRVSYVQASTQTSISVVVNEPAGQVDADLDGVTVTDLDPMTNGNGINFQVRKLTFDLGASGSSVSYTGGTTLPSGNSLVISVINAVDSDTLLQILTEVLQSVQFTS